LDVSGDEGFLHLRRVLPAPAQSDEDIRVLTLEVYEDGFIIRWVLPSGLEGPASAEEAALNPMGLMSLTLRDALGTPYEMVGMTGGGKHGYTMFRPAIPAEALWLDVFTRGGVVRFDLAE
jgi:hypothetical protein